MSSIRAYPTKPAAVLRFTGEDHSDFLQSQSTADLRGPAGLCRYSLWLDHKGLIHGDSFVLKISDEEMMLVSHETPASSLIAKFNRHIIADDVEIDDFSDQWKLLSIDAGSVPQFLEVRGCRLNADTFNMESDGYIFKGRQLGRGSVDYLLPSTLESPLDIATLSPAEADSMRVAAGMLSIPRDIEPGSFNPLEANLLSALSFDKGCYLGQEVVTRVHRLDRLSRRFVSFSGIGKVQAAPHELNDSGKAVGAITSVAKSNDKITALGWLKSRYPDGTVRLDEGDFEVRTLPEA